MEKSTTDKEKVPVLVLIGQVGAGKSFLATALAGLPHNNTVFKVGDSVNAVTMETVCHKAHWFGLPIEEDVLLVDPPGVGDGEGRDAAHLSKVICTLQNLGHVNSFLVVLNAAQPRMGSTLNNVLQLMEECFGRKFWRHVVLVFTRYYTDASSARRRGGRTQAAMRAEFSAAIGAQFPHASSQRVPPGEPFPCYFVDSDAVVSKDAPEAERKAAMLELERLSVMTRSTPALTTMRSSTCEDIRKPVVEPSEKDAILLGTWVCIQGVNGSNVSKSSEGRVVEIHEADGRYVVELADGSRTLFKAEQLNCLADEAELMKPKQIDENARVKIQGLLSACELNGQVGRILNFNPCTQRYSVKLANGAMKSIKPINLREISNDAFDEPELLTVGSKVEVQGLIGSPELNGKLGVVVDCDARRCNVKLADGSPKTIKVANLRQVQLNVAPGEAVNLVNIFNGAAVKRGTDWMWDDQDGGEGVTGHVTSWDQNTLWAKVRWNTGPVNSYRIGLGGHYDLSFADEKSYQEGYQSALRKGRHGLMVNHLQRTFLYYGDLKRADLVYFDIRDEVCEAVGGFKHGQVVWYAGIIKAVTVGVAPDLPRGNLRLWFHPFDPGNELGAGLIDEDNLHVIGTEVLDEVDPAHNHTNLDAPDNESLQKVKLSLTPNFRYLEGCGSWSAAQMQWYDIRDEICQHWDVKHGQVFKTKLNTSLGKSKLVVIGVRIHRDKPVLFVHQCDDHPGAAIVSNGFMPFYSKLIGTQNVQAANEHVLEPPPISAFLKEIAPTLQGTFCYPKGALVATPGFFDIREHMCMQVGGFRHGQVVKDKDGNKSVVIGVLDTGDKDPEKLQLFFHPEGAPGCGVFERYHLYRLDLQAVGFKTVHEVPTDHQMYKEWKRLTGQAATLASKLSRDDLELLHAELSKNKLTSSDISDLYSRWLLTSTSSKEKSTSCEKESTDALISRLLLEHVKEACESEDGDNSKASKSSEWHGSGHSKFEFSFQYRISTSDVESFDIRDEVCQAVGGFRHGEVLAMLGLEATVIGVKLDKTGKPELWVKQADKDGIVFPLELKPLTTVIDRIKLVATEDPATQVLFTPDFVASLTFTFKYLVAEGPISLRRFDIRDEICLQVGGFTHGQLLQLSESVEVVVVGVIIFKDCPCLFTHTLKPEPKPGATLIRDLAKACVVCKGIEELKEVTDTEYATMTMDSVASLENPAEVEHEKLESSVDDTTEKLAKAVLEGKMSSSSISNAVVYRLSRNSVSITALLLESSDLAECHARVRVAGCELQPHWANGAILFLPLAEIQVKEIGIELRSHNIIALAEDQERIARVLSTLPCRQRPKLKLSQGEKEKGPTDHIKVELIVERTFLHFPTSDTPSESSSMIHSAPCGSMVREPSNPRRFKAAAAAME